jgi:putative hemolysin
MLVFELAVVAGLILLNGFFAMSELAVMSSRRGRLANLAQGGRKGAATALRLYDDPTGFLSTVQVGITLVGIFAGAYSGTAFAEPLAGLLRAMTGLGGGADTLAFGLVVVTITYLSLIVGELVPKRIALNNSEAIASRIARPMAQLARIGAPVVWFLSLSTEGVLRLVGIAPRAETTVTEEEVRSLIAEGTEAGVFKPAEREMIEGVIRIADRSVRSIMIPRREAAWLDIEAPDETIFDEVHRHGHSRYLVCRGDVDDILGIAHTRDMLDQLRRTGALDLAAIVREPLYVSESMPVLAILDRFRDAATHMAVIVDEHGALEGIVTPMDMLIGIAGDLPDHGETVEPDAVERPDGSWLLEASMPVHAVERVLAVPDMAFGDYETLAGFVLHQLGHLPESGESVTWKGWRFEVIDMDGRRIDKVLASRAES